MALFIIERNFAEAISVNADDPEILRVVEDVGVRWLYSFLSADKKKTYCLYEAPNPDAIREVAKKLNMPADVVIEVDPIRGPNLEGGLTTL